MSGHYLKVVYDLMLLLQSKLLDYAKASPLKDSAWSAKFKHTYSTLTQLEKINYTDIKFSKACQDLSRHMTVVQKRFRKRIPKYSYESQERLDFFPRLDQFKVRTNYSEALTDKAKPLRQPRRRLRKKPSLYYDDMMLNLLNKDHTPKRAMPSTLSKTNSKSLIQDRDFWLIEDNIQFVKS